MSDVGLIGLAVMGQNLALNIADHGYSLSAYNRSQEKVAALLERSEDHHRITGCASVEEFVESLSTPRTIIVMVRAGDAVDAVIDQLEPLLDEGDIVIDAGNSHFPDSERRGERLAAAGLRFVGAGVSGGEEGARFGPSIMPGGDESAWPVIEPVLTAIAAKAGDDEPCCSWLGAGGAGHFVKMVHNGIEYGDMQVLAEAHALMNTAGVSAADQAAMVAKWNEGRLRSYLVEITAEILATTEPDGQPTIDVILDAAGQKGTGRWTAVSAMELGQPVTLVAEAVSARSLSALVDLRAASTSLPGPAEPASVADLDRLDEAVYAAKLLSYTQGFMMLAAASHEYGWKLDMAAIARLWRGGCIIRADFLDDIASAFERNPDLAHLALDEHLGAELASTIDALREHVVAGAAAGCALPAMGSALAFFDGLRTARGPASLIQAQRDYFGAHTYERLDRPRGEWFHTDWASTGGTAVSGSYST